MILGRMLVFGLEKWYPRAYTGMAAFYEFLEDKLLMPMPS
jgi:hypothetical protein